MDASVVLALVAIVAAVFGLCAYGSHRRRKIEEAAGRMRKVW